MENKRDGEKRPVCTKKSVKNLQLQPLEKKATKLRTKIQVQDYNELKNKCLEDGILFEDPDFPCEASSLYFSKKPKGDIKWKRPKEIIDAPKFFVGGVSRFDIRQGQLGGVQGEVEWKTNVFEGEWIRGVSAGDCLNYQSSTFVNNPQYRLTVVDPDEDDDDDKCTIIVALMQKHRRARGMENLHIGFAIYHLKDSDHLQGLLDLDFFEKNEPCEYLQDFINSREVIGRFGLVPGVYCIVPSTFDPSEDGEFILRVFSEKKNYMEEIDDEIGIVEKIDSTAYVNKLGNEIQEDEDYEEKRLQELFYKEVGGDDKVDWRGLQSILDFEMQKELSDNEFSTENRTHFLATIISSISGLLFSNTRLGRSLENPESAERTSRLITPLLMCGCKTFCRKTPIAQVLEPEKDGFSEDVCRSMIAIFDTNRSGKLDFEDFKSLWKDIEGWKHIFNKFDTKKSNKLSTYDLRKIFKLVNYNVDKPLLEAFIRRYGTRDNYILFDNFIMCTVKLKIMIDIFKKRDVENKKKATFTYEEWLKMTLCS